MEAGNDAAVAIVLAAGAGRRVGAEEPKAFLTIGGRPMLAVAAGAAAASPAVGALIVTAPAGWEEEAQACVEACGVPVTVVTGGATRQQSVQVALEALPLDSKIVAVHDAARPFAPPDLFTAVVEAVSAEVQGVVPIAPVTDTVKQVVDGRVVGTLDRERLGLAQTPQAFDASFLRAAHRRAAASGVALTDDAAALEREGAVVVAIAGDPNNVKITTLLDLANADTRMGGTDG
ncbi:MAG: 2-C-methyl-D-erythritol 4-phosphate cytidylyltransferase [Actinomycetota bacterium]|nr:2-C-methyl-D-erythritol 4-phosphate cytidylyltransferase [Actinomycetota bacterium]